MIGSTETLKAEQHEDASSIFSGVASVCAIRPILSAGWMVRAILAGEKTQTRRIVKPQPPDHHWDSLPGYERLTSLVECNDGRIHARLQDSIPQNIDNPVWRKYPYGKPGDRLWVRETWQQDPFGEYHYRADGHDLVDPTTGDRVPWKPSIHMPRTACRLLLLIEDVRVENYSP